MCAQPAAGHRYEHRARFSYVLPPWQARQDSQPGATAASRWPAGTAQLAPEPAARLGPAASAYGSNLGLAYCTDKARLLVPDTGRQRPIGVPRPL